MRSRLRFASVLLCSAGMAVVMSFQGRAQEPAKAPAAERSAAASASDPRVGLKAGFRDAGEAISNLERVSSLPKPEGFFDPKLPAGDATPP